MTSKSGIKSSGDGKFHTWDEINQHFIKLTEEHSSEMMQTMNLLTFVQLLGDTEMDGVELTMYTDKPDVVTFDIIRENGDNRFFVSNVTFMLDGTTMLSVSDYQKRGWAKFLKMFFMFPRFKRKFFYFVFEPTLVTHDLMTKFLFIATEISKNVPETFKLEAYVTDLLGAKAEHL